MDDDKLYTESEMNEAFRAGKEYIDVYGFAEDEVEFVNHNFKEWLEKFNTKKKWMK